VQRGLAAPATRDLWYRIATAARFLFPHFLRGLPAISGPPALLEALMSTPTQPLPTHRPGRPRRTALAVAARWLAPSLLSVAAAAGCLSLLSATRPSATAQSRPMSAAPRVAVVDMNRILDQLDEQRTRLSEIDALRNELQRRIEELAGNLHTLTNEIKVLPPNSPERQKATEEAARLEVRIKTEERFAQLLVENRTVQILSELFNKIEQAVSDYAAREGYSVVIASDKGAALPAGASYQQANLFFSSRRVLHVSPDADISEQVATAMNNAYRLKGNNP
jgi:Skp family chaperone for outer membrane proteins